VLPSLLCRLLIRIGTAAWRSSQRINNMNSPPGNHLVLPPDPLVEAHLKQQADEAARYARVEEWQKTVDEPLDALIPRYADAWQSLRNAMSEYWQKPEGVEHIVQPLRSVAACVRELESMRLLAQQWSNAGTSGHFSVSAWRLYWCETTIPLTDRFQHPAVVVSGLPQSFKIAVRILTIAFESSEELLLPQLERLRMLPGYAEATIWFPFFETILLPLPSKLPRLDPNTRISVCREAIEQEVLDRVPVFSLPQPSELLTLGEIWEAGFRGTFHIGQMGGQAFDGVRKGLRGRLELDVNPTSVDGGPAMILGRAVTATGLDVNPTTVDGDRNETITPQLNLNPTGTYPDGASTQTSNQLDQSATIKLLSVLTNGLSDDRIGQSIIVLGDKNFNANEKLSRLHQLLPIPATTSAEQLGKLLGVTKHAIWKTDWWTNNRKGEKADEIGRRRDKHKQRADESPRGGGG
jgi:hypothetical protein